MSNILKNIVIDPSSYFVEDELETLHKFVVEYDYAAIKLKAELARVNLEIAKIMGIK